MQKLCNLPNVTKILIKMPTINGKDMVNKSVLVQNFLEQARVPLTVPWSLLRDWSLIIQRRGEATKREGGGHVKFYPYEKGERGKF